MFCLMGMMRMIKTIKIQMFNKLFQALNNGVKKLRANQKLWYTIFVAFLILVAFIFVANNFVIIAQDAQNRLVNVRLGAMQDSLVQFAPDYFITDTEILRDKVRRIAFGDQTIKDFKIVRFDEYEQPIIVASLDKKELEHPDSDHELNYNIAKNNPKSSFTIESLDGEDGERVYTTARIITNDYGKNIGAVLTTQSLSAADLKITESIQKSVLIFIVIIVLIMFLFFKHARSIDYISLYRKLKGVDQLKDDFISMASHELRTPLTLIRGYTEELSEIKRMPKSSREAVDRINIVTNQLDNLVNDMLDVSRIDQGRMKIELKLENPVPLVEEVVTSFSSIAKEKGLKLTFLNSLKTDIGLMIDINKFRQVIINLISNAIKYTKEGSIEVEMKIVHKNLQIRVSDTGIGMTAEQLKQLFQRFYRVKSDETIEIRGTGLGLWISREIVQLMNGKIWAESIKEVGTHFVVEFKLE